MTADARRIGIAAGATAAGNAVLFLAAAWALAVFRGLHPGATAVALAPVPPTPVSIVVVPAAADRPTAPDERRHIQAPPGVPDQAPQNPAAFQSSQNMRAASRDAPTAGGDRNRPSIQGIERPFQELADSEFQDGEIDPQTAAAAPASAPSAASPPSPPAPDVPPSTDRPAPPSAEPAAASVADSPPESAPPAFRDLAADSSLPAEPIAPAAPPAARPAPDSPPNPAAARPPAPAGSDTAFRPQTRKARSSGSISTRSATASVDAEATPEGRYGRTIYNIIGRNWQRKMQELGGLVNTGLVEIDFEIDLQGRISSIRLANPGEANPVLQDCALSAVLDARLPPPPEELVRALSDRIAGGRFPQRMSFLSY